MRFVWRQTPWLIGLIALGIPIYFWISKAPTFVDLETLQSGNLTKAQEQALSMVMELNKFLISLVTLTFGGVGFLLMHYRKNITVVPITIAFLIALVLLGTSYYFSFLTFSRVAAELAQNAIGLEPGKSRVFYYLELEFWTFLGASLIMLFLFTFVVFSERKEG